MILAAGICAASSSLYADATPDPIDQLADKATATNNTSVERMMDNLHIDSDTAWKVFHRLEERDCGPAPEIHGLWGVSIEVHDAIKKQISDPDSYKFVQAGGAWEDEYQGKHCWLEKVMFLSKNQFGGYVRSIADVKVVKSSPTSIETVLDVTIENWLRAATSKSDKTNDLKIGWCIRVV
jgi:hypothetical protein